MEPGGKCIDTANALSFSNAAEVLEDDCEADGFPVYKHLLTPKGTRRASVAWAIRPKPRNPTVRPGVYVGVPDAVGRLEILSCGPQKANGDQVKLGHLPVCTASIVSFAFRDAMRARRTATSATGRFRLDKSR